MYLGKTIFLRGRWIYFQGSNIFQQSVKKTTEQIIHN